MISPYCLDPLQAKYQSVVTNVRICQLCAFLLLLEILMQPLTFALTAVVAVFGVAASVAAGTPPPLDWPEIHFRSLVEIVYLANVWMLLCYYACFKRAYWLLIFCAASLAHNIYVTFDGTDLRGRTGIVFTASGFDLSFESAFARDVFFAGAFGSPLLFFWVAVRGQRDIH